MDKRRLKRSSTIPNLTPNPLSDRSDNPMARAVHSPPCPPGSGTGNLQRQLYIMQQGRKTDRERIELLEKHIASKESMIFAQEEIIHELETLSKNQRHLIDAKDKAIGVLKSKADQRDAFRSEFMRQKEILREEHEKNYRMLEFILVPRRSSKGLIEFIEEHYVEEAIRFHKEHPSTLPRAEAKPMPKPMPTPKPKTDGADRK